PYGITGWKGRWYLGGYCCLRQDYRSFRLDRIQQLQVLTETFEKAKDFDFEAFVRENYQKSGTQMEVEFQADMATVQQKIPAEYGKLTPTPTGVLLQEQYDDVESMSRYLMALNLPFVIHHPPQLREALLRLGERMVQIATRAR
ncbi:MAG: WYL domain-containing protein, partial [Ktedonobacteraceae bacterium]